MSATKSKPRTPTADLTAADVPGRVRDAVLSHISYKPTVKSDPIQVSLARAGSITFERAVPVRKPTSYQGQWNKPGYYFMSSIGDLVSYESRFEMSHLMLLDRDPTVTAICSQPFRVHWRDLGGQARTHVPDFFVRRHDGSADVIDVKGSARAGTPANALVFGVTARACEAAGFGFHVANDIPGVVLENVRWLSAYRHVPQQADTIGAHVLAAVSGAVGLAGVIDQAAASSGAHPLRVKAVVFSLLWEGNLVCNLSIPLSSHTLLTVNHEGACNVA